MTIQFDCTTGEMSAKQMTLQYSSEARDVWQMTDWPMIVERVRELPNLRELVLWFDTVQDGEEFVRGHLEKAQGLFGKDGAITVKVQAREKHDGSDKVTRTMCVCYPGGSVEYRTDVRMGTHIGASLSV